MGYSQSSRAQSIHRCLPRVVACSVSRSSLCLDGLSLASSGPLITSLSPFLSPSFCPRQVYTKLKWCQHDTRVYLVDNQELLRAGAMILLFLVTGQVQFLFHHVCLFYVAVAKHPEPSAGSPAAEREAVTCWGSKVRNGEAN